MTLLQLIEERLEEYKKMPTQSFTSMDDVWVTYEDGSLGKFSCACSVRGDGTFTITGSPIRIEHKEPIDFIQQSLDHFPDEHF